MLVHSSPERIITQFSTKHMLVISIGFYSGLSMGKLGVVVSKHSIFHMMQLNGRPEIHSEV